MADKRTPDPSRVPRSSAGLLATFILAMVLPTNAIALQVVAEISTTYDDPSSLTWDGSSLWTQDAGLRIHRHDPDSGAELWNVMPETGAFQATTIASDGHHLWGCSWPGLEIAEIDPVSGKVLRRLRLHSADGIIAGSPYGLVWKDGALWMLMSGPVSICRVEPATGEITQKLPLAYPYAVALAWDGRSFWIGNREDQRLYEIDPQTGATVGSIPAPGDGVRGLAWDGRYLWLSGRHLYKLDRNAEPHEVMGEVRSFWWGYYNTYRDLALDHGRLWLSGLNLHLMDPDTGTEIRVVEDPNGLGASGIAFDGYHLWSINRYSWNVYLLEPADGSVLASYSYEGGEPAGMTYEGGHIWIADVTNGLLRREIWPPFTQQAAIPAPGPEPTGVTWDGKSLWTSDRSTGLLTQLGPGGLGVAAQFRLPMPFPLGVAADTSRGTLWALDGGGHRTVELAYPPGPTHVVGWSSSEVGSSVVLSWSLTAGSTSMPIAVERRAGVTGNYSVVGSASCGGTDCEFVDPAPVSGGLSYYRLRIQEADGSLKTIGPLSVAHQYSYGPISSLVAAGELRAGARPTLSYDRGEVRIWAVASPGRRVRARVFDIRGRLVRTMDLSESTQGVSEASWDGNDGNGRRASPGVYFAALADDAGARATVKITILR
jgi:hypothetical protein